MSTQYDQQKQNAGAVAAIFFLISSLYLCLSTGTFHSLFSLKWALSLLKGTLFLLTGMFGVALIIGIPTYLLQRAAVKAFMKLLPRNPSDAFSSRTVNQVSIIS